MRSRQILQMTYILFKGLDRSELDIFKIYFFLQKCKYYFHKTLYALFTSFSEGSHSQMLTGQRAKKYNWNYMNNFTFIVHIYSSKY